MSLGVSVSGNKTLIEGIFIFKSQYVAFKGNWQFNGHKNHKEQVKP